MAKILFRQIKARAGYPNFDAMLREVEKTIEARVKPELLVAFNEIVADWEHHVDFRARKLLTAEGISVYVWPTGPNAKFWIWVSGGTKAHTIVSEAVGVPLRFRTDYHPKTQPIRGGVRYGGPGISIGPWVAKESVEHPGIKPREFEKHIARLYMPKFRKHMEAALRRGAKKL